MPLRRTRNFAVSKISTMKIIVTGSLGHISRPLTQRLVRGGHSVTVISSNPDRKREIETLGANAAIGSFEDIPFLTRAFAGADAVYTMMPPRPFLEPDYTLYGRRIGEHYTSAVRGSGIKKIVNLSSWGADLDKGTGFILAAHQLEIELNGLQDVALVHLRPTSFYYNMLDFIPMIKAAGFIALNYGEEDRLVLVAPEDIADAAAEELVRPDATGRRIRYIASEETTCKEAVQVLGQAIGKPDLMWKRLTDEQLLASLTGNGVPGHVAANIVELGNASRRGLLRRDYDLHKPTLGKIKLKDFAKTFATKFNQQ